MRPLPELLGQLRQFISNLGVGVAHAERRYAKQASTQLLELYESERRERSQLDTRSLYEAVIARRLGLKSSRAAEIVRRAEESFTTWPVECELRFRHVVQYQIFDEYIRLGADRAGTRTNIGAVVARIIPEEI
jgi:hypothetical protein